MTLLDAVSFCQSLSDNPKSFLIIERNCIVFELKEAQVSVKIETGLEPCKVDCKKFLELLASAGARLAFTQTDSTITLSSEDGTVTIETYPLDEKTAHKITTENMVKICAKTIYDLALKANSMLDITKEAVLYFGQNSIACGDKSNIFLMKNPTEIINIAMGSYQFKLLKKLKGIRLIRFSNSEKFHTVWGGNFYISFANQKLSSLGGGAAIEIINRSKNKQPLPADFFKKLKSVITIIGEDCITLHSNTIQNGSGEVFASFNFKTHFQDSTFFIKKLLGCAKFKPHFFESSKEYMLFSSPGEFLIIAANKTDPKAEEIEKASGEFNAKF